LTTALSNDNDTSNIHKISTIKVVCNPPGMFNSLPAHKKNAMMIATILNISEPLKCFMVVSSNIKYIYIPYCFTILRISLNGTKLYHLFLFSLLMRYAIFRW
jgi:hypothetical protein